MRYEISVNIGMMICCHQGEIYPIVGIVYAWFAMDNVCTIHIVCSPLDTQHEYI